MSQEISDDAFKVASIACQLANGSIPTQEHLETAISILRESESTLCELARLDDDKKIENRKGADLLGKTTFLEFLQENTDGHDYADIGKVTSITGVKKIIRKYLPSRKELDAFTHCDLTRGNYEEWVKTRPIREKGSISEKLLCAKEAGIPEEKWWYLSMSVYLRCSQEIIDSGFVVMDEQYQLVIGYKERFLSEK